MYPKLLAAMLAALCVVPLPASAVEVNFEFLETKPGEWDVLAEVIPENGDTLGLNGFAFNVFGVPNNQVSYEPSQLKAINPETFEILGFARPTLSGPVGGSSGYYSASHQQATTSGESELFGIGIEPLNVDSFGGVLQIGVPAQLGTLRTPSGLTAENFADTQVSLFPANYSGLQNTPTFGVFAGDPNFNLQVTGYQELQNQASYSIEFNEVERGVFDVMATIDPRLTGIQGIAGYSFNLSGPGGVAASVSQPGLSAIDPATSTPVGFPSPTLTSTANSQRVSSSQATSGGTSELFGFGINPVSFDGVGGNDIQAGVPVMLSRITVPEGAGQLDFSDFELSLFPAGYDGLDNGSLVTASSENSRFRVTENRLAPDVAPRTTPSLYPRLTEISPGVWEVSARVSDFSSGVAGLADYTFELTGIDPAEVTFEQGNLSGVDSSTLAPRGFAAPQINVVGDKIVVSSSQTTSTGEGEIRGLGIHPVNFDGQGNNDVTSPDRVVLGTLTTPTGQAPRNFGEFRLGLLPADYSGSATTPVESFTTADDNVTLDVKPFVERGANEEAEIRFVETKPGEWQVFVESHYTDTESLGTYTIELTDLTSDATLYVAGNLNTIDPDSLEVIGFQEPLQSTHNFGPSKTFVLSSTQVTPEGTSEVRGIGVVPVAVDGTGPSDIDLDDSALLGTLYTESGLTPENFRRVDTSWMPVGYSGVVNGDLRRLSFVNRGSFQVRNLLGVQVFPIDYVAPEVDPINRFAGDVSLTDDSMLSPVDGGSEIRSRTTTVVVDDGIVRMALSVTLSGFGADGLPVAVQANSEGQLGVGDGVLDAGEAIAVHYNSVEFSLVEGADPSLVDLDRVRAEFSGFGVAGDFADDEDGVLFDGLATDQFDTAATATGSLLGLQQSSAIMPGLSFTITAQSGGFGLQSLAHLISYDQTAVPEPASLALATLATAALVFTTRPRISRR